MRKIMILMVLFSSLLIATQQDGKYAENKSNNEETKLVDNKTPASNSGLYKKTESKIENQENDFQQQKKPIPSTASSRSSEDTNIPLLCGCCIMVIIVAIFYSVMP